MSGTYKIVRHFQQGDNQVVRRGLTLEEAQAHCSDPETSSSTATSEEAVERTELHGPWFDGYTDEFPSDEELEERRRVEERQLEGIALLQKLLR